MKYAAIPRTQKMSLDASFSSVGVLVRNIAVLRGRKLVTSAI